MKNLFLTNRFFYFFGLVVICFTASFFVPIFLLAQALLIIGFIITLVDVLLIFNKNTQLKIKRILPRLFSLGDDNPVEIEIKSLSNQVLNLEVIDEMPIQFQKRDAAIKLVLQPQEVRTLSYTLRPTVRGDYAFGQVNAFISGRIGFIQRRIRTSEAMTASVYPSIIQMKQLELKAFDRISTTGGGIKKIRRIGHSYEFEQIKEYVRGDDYRSINWKATSRSNRLMVNQYEDEKAQQIYCLIDKSRSMKMPFEGLTLMDYAINTTLVISNIAVKKYDRAGMISFSDIIGTTIKAERKSNQMQKILQALYREEERPLEANFELLYRAVRNLIRGRSLLFLFSNFESKYALDRVLPVLRRLSRQHLLVVVFFENTEIKNFSEQEANNIDEIYHQTIAGNYLYEKQQMVYKLKQLGIQAILTRPEDLSLNALNKYLELKSRGLI